MITYKAILRNDRLEWRGPMPSQIGPDQPVAVHVTILEESVLEPGRERGLEMATALEQLAAMDALADITDPVAWEREMRQDRILPGREPDDVY